MPETEATPQTPAINQEALQAAVKSSVREVLGEVAGQAQHQQQQRQQQHQAQQAQQNAVQDPIYMGVVRPYVEPIANRVLLESQSALDAVRFYNQTPEAGKYTKQIEADFEAAKAAGMPVDRQTVWNHFRGANLNHFATQLQEQARQSHAANASVGAAGIGRPDQQPFNPDEFRNLPLAEMEKRLDGVKF